MIIGLLRIFAILCAAVVCGKLVSKGKLPAILGWLIAGIVSGTIVAAAIINEIIAVIVAKFAFKWAGEIQN